MAHTWFEVTNHSKPKHRFKMDNSCQFIPSVVFIQSTLCKSNLSHLYSCIPVSRILSEHKSDNLKEISVEAKSNLKFLIHKFTSFFDILK